VRRVREAVNWFYAPVSAHENLFHTKDSWNTDIDYSEGRNHPT